MTFKCDKCGKSNSTEAGLALHMKVFHRPEETPVKKAEQATKASDKKAATPKVAKSKEASIEQVTKESIELYVTVKKKFKQKPTGVEHNSTVKKAALKKIFPEGMKSRLLGNAVPQKVHSHLEASYKAIVLTTDKGWRRVRLIGNKTMITWAEGPYKGKYKVTFPNLSKR